MTWALLGLGSLSIGALLSLAILLYRAQRETMHIRDLLDAKDELADQYQHERDVEVAAHGVTSAELKEAKQRLSVAEAQRNEVMRREAERLKESDVHTVADVLLDSLGQPWKPVRGVPSVSNTSHPSAGSDDLEKP